MKYYLGIDGGGTKTVAVVTDKNGKISAKVTGKSINYYSVGIHCARNNLKEIIDMLYNTLGEIQFDGAYIGCSALDSEADEEATDKLCRDIINAKKLKMHSDVFIALKSLGDINCPCVAICGTGSIAVGEAENGRIVVAGGWGHVLGDEGSAYSIALSALKECCYFDDCGVKNELIRCAEEYFNVTSYRKVIDIIYSPETTKDYIAGFAEKVGQLSRNGNEMCKKITENEAVAFSKTVITLLNNLKVCSALGLSGGVFKNNILFTETFKNEVSAKFPSLKITDLIITPEECAAKLAREL